jgi:hypothetical protein
MKQNTLSQTNPHISDRRMAHKALIRNLASSTAIETGESIEKIENKLSVKHFSRFPVTLA